MNAKVAVAALIFFARLCASSYLFAIPNESRRLFTHSFGSHISASALRGGDETPIVVDSQLFKGHRRRMQAISDSIAANSVVGIPTAVNQTGAARYLDPFMHGRADFPDSLFHPPA